MQKSDVDLLKGGLLDKRTVALFSVMTLLSAFAVGEHIFLRFPWKNNNILHGQCVWFYLFPPILAVALIGAFKLLQGASTTPELRSAVQKIYENGKRDGTIGNTESQRIEIIRKTDKAACSLVQSFNPRKEEIFVTCAILSVACMTVAGCLDKTIHPKKVMTLAIIESILFASTLASLLVLWVTLYFANAGESLQSSHPNGKKRINQLIDGLYLSRDASYFCAPTLFGEIRTSAHDALLTEGRSLR